MDAHGLEGPWSFQRDLKIILEIKVRKVDPQQPKGLESQLPKGLVPKWNHKAPHDKGCYVIPLCTYSKHVFVQFAPPVKGQKPHTSSHGNNMR